MYEFISYVKALIVLFNLTKLVCFVWSISDNGETLDPDASTQPYRDENSLFFIPSL